MLAAVVLAATGCGGGNSALSQSAASVQSLAAEGALLADDSADGRTIGTYLRVHADELSAAAGKLATQLTATPGSGSAQQQLASLALAAETALNRLPTAGKPEAQAIEQQLNRIARHAKRLGTALA